MLRVYNTYGSIISLFGWCRQYREVCVQYMNTYVTHRVAAGDALQYTRTQCRSKVYSTFKCIRVYCNWSTAATLCTTQVCMHNCTHTSRYWRHARVYSCLNPAKDQNNDTVRIIHTTSQNKTSSGACVLKSRRGLASVGQKKKLRCP